MTDTQFGNGCNNNQSQNNKNHTSEIMLFLGAGASLPAGITGVEGMVNKLIEDLQKTSYGEYLKIVIEIIDLLRNWIKEKEDKKVDIELLLETIEKMENVNNDVVSLLFEKKAAFLSRLENIIAKNGRGTLLSTIVKKFIKSETGKVEIKIDYLDGLLKLMEYYRPLNIFSTNYDICIERFCYLRNKRYFDGFYGEWSPERFEETNMDIRLFKLHGSVTWSRSETGKYTKNEISIQEDYNMQTNIVTGKTEIPLIVYPGKKLDYNEPVYDILIQLKKYLNCVKYVFVIGYTFRDDHLRRLFQYAARKNSDLTIFLISPSAHEIYQSNVIKYKDSDFQHGFDPEGFDSEAFDTEVFSNLKGRVICLPYKIECVIDILHKVYLKNLIEGRSLEAERELEMTTGTDSMNKVVRWDDCLLSYMNCEYTDKILEIVEHRMSWEKLLNINYKLGIEIIARSFLSSLLWNKGKEFWLDAYRKYLPITPARLKVKMNNSTDMFLYLEFDYFYQVPLLGEDLYSYYLSLLQIYNNHIIFLNDKIKRTDTNNDLYLQQIIHYLEPWQESIKLTEYVDLRNDRLEPSELDTLKTEIRNYIANKSEEGLKGILEKIKGIERRELSVLVP